MTNPELLRQYIEHLEARVRSQSTPLPDSVNDLCKSDPKACLALVVDALSEVKSPNLVHAIGDEVLENLLNEHAGGLEPEIASLLRNDQRFRYAFASGRHASVDPALIADWVRILQDLGTTKQAERKRLWSKRY